MIRMAVTDMDGTLLDSLAEISKANEEAVFELQRQGVEFVAASGRDYTSVQPLLERYQIRCERSWETAFSMWIEAGMC